MHSVNTMLQYIINKIHINILTLNFQDGTRPTLSLRPGMLDVLVLTESRDPRAAGSAANGVLVRMVAFTSGLNTQDGLSSALPSQSGVRSASSMPMFDDGWMDRGKWRHTEE